MALIGDSPAALVLGRQQPMDSHDHVLGVWALVGDGARENIAFSSTPRSQVQVWRSELPANPHEAVALQQHASRQLDSTEKVLRAAASQLRVLGELPTLAAAAPPNSTHRLLEVCRAAATGRASIETLVGGRLVGWSMLDWAGRIETVWPVELRPHDVALHSAALHLAMTTRAALVHVLTIAAEGAAVLAAASSPLGPLAALPLAWAFVARVLEEGEWLRTQRQALQTTPSF